MRLSLIDYMSYIGGSSSSRCVYEGEEVLNAGHIIVCGKLDSSTQDIINLCALCLQTSALTSDPHKITGQLKNILGKVVIKDMICSCKAGQSGKCKHISAVLIKCTRDDLQNLEEISATDLKCVWSQQKNVTKQKYQAIPLKDMPCLSSKINKSDNSILDKNKIFDFFVSKLPHSAIAKHRFGRRFISDDDDVRPCTSANTVCNYFIEVLDNACQSPLFMELYSLIPGFESDCCHITYNNFFNNEASTIIALKQGSKEWFEERKYRVTGSRIYDLFTYSKNDWKSKSLKYFFPKSYSNKFTKHGIKYEGAAREAFVLHTGFQVIECGLVISETEPWLGFSPDGIVIEKDKPVAIVEIKCLYEGASITINEAIKKASFLTEQNNNYFLKEKHRYYGQVQLGMALVNGNGKYS